MPVKTRYFLYISFKGTSYHGWQIQPESITVQKILEDSLSTVLSEKIGTTGAGRTDAGVHASFFCVHFDSEKADLEYGKNFLFRLNGILPNDISVNEIRKVLPDAHARFSAISRTYQYYISRKKDPFRQESSWYVFGDLDINLMNEASALLLNESDFTSFSRLHSDNKTNICKIYHASWEEKEDILIFTIKADRFLRNMVRAITGTLIDVGRGKISIAGFRNIIKAQNRGSAGKSAPAKGLFLTGIEYPTEIFQKA
ncbi:MAG TPA: tRNA pseudouridine(38-40) synthase TruA [Bacteroidales bacterium]|nr:tRNA pseudouridine(38-40) synthase TruA [Bacteroidales bacterium]